jgi:L-seryl-tRNA(Ser) seleniumtransferase
VIGRITNHPLFAASRLDVLRSAALLATLERFDDQHSAQEQLPVWQCLTTSVENLRNRAERMAVQLGHAPGIASSTPADTRSPLFPAFTEGCPSYGVVLAPADGDVQSLVARLRSAPLPVLGRVDGDRLVLDLRTVLPRQDALLVDTLLGSPTSGEVAPHVGNSV